MAPTFSKKRANSYWDKDQVRFSKCTAKEVLYATMYAKCKRHTMIPTDAAKYLWDKSTKDFCKILDHIEEYNGELEVVYNGGEKGKQQQRKGEMFHFHYMLGIQLARKNRKSRKHHVLRGILYCDNDIVPGYRYITSWFVSLRKYNVKDIEILMECIRLMTKSVQHIISGCLDNGPAYF